MAQEKPNRLVELLLLLREQGPALRRRMGLWLEAVREEPVLIWATPAVRYAGYGLGAVIVLAATLQIAGMITPPPPPGASAPAASADFHVVCSDPACAHHFVIHRQFGFHKFPVQCLKCKRQTGARARLCNSSTCRGQWVALEAGVSKPRAESGSVKAPE